jgi:hypothetical protein
MNTEVEQEKDHFWFYVGGVAFVLISVVLMIKKTETDKFAPIRQQVIEEHKSMNIRILKNYE